MEITRQLIDQLSHIGMALSSEHRLDHLLELIVESSRAFTNADGGTLFLVDEQAQQLSWAIIQNETMGIRIGGSSAEKPDRSIFKPFEMLDEQAQPILSNAAVCAAHTGESINIADVYDETDAFDFEGPLRFDAQTGYRTRSILVVPLKHFEVGVIGVLQLINARAPDGSLIEFDPDFENLVASLASQAAVALQNARLFDELEAQFEAFIATIAAAIDEKSKYTAGHVRRVVDLSMSLARAVHHSDEGAFESVRFSDDQLKALRIASWMHDVGKIATPEYVVDKATKLCTIFDRIELIATRYDLLKQQAENRAVQAQLEAIQSGQYNETLAQHIQAQLNEERAQLDDELAFIRRCNQGREFMADEMLTRLQVIAAKTFLHHGEQKPRLTEDELYNLSIRKGTLTAEEIDVIRNHALISYKMLSKLPFSRHLAEVPEIAAGHHEKLNGKGYPRGLHADQLGLEARILAIADIFEALTAADRPYKKPTPLSIVKRILNAMVQDGELDGQLVDFAMRSGVFDAYVAREVAESQRDLRFQSS